METYSLIFVSDETRPIRRFDLPRVAVRRAAWGAGIAALVLLVGFVDYVRMRIDNLELAELRIETAEQQARIASFDEAVSNVTDTLQQVRELERKVRIIANLPGSAAAGGADVVEVGPGGEGGDIDAGNADYLPTGEGIAPALPAAASRAGSRSTSGSVDDRISALRQEALRLDHVAQQRQLSLQELVSALEDKHHKLASSPAVWPTQGWLTSRFGTRISPFTGKRQFHSGVDIAGAPGTDVIATARGKVIFAGRKGPLGNAIILDHGYGVQTHYGHTKELFVKKGQEVQRGEVIATLGSSGRSTGPHLHYTVEVRGKAVNPLDYIFD